MANNFFNGWYLSAGTLLYVQSNSSAGDFGAVSGITLTTSQANLPEFLDENDPNSILNGSIKCTTKGLQFENGPLSDFDAINTDWTIEGFFRVSPKSSETLPSSIFALEIDSPGVYYCYLTIGNDGKILFAPYLRGYAPGPSEPDIFVNSEERYDDGNIHHYSIVYSKDTRFYHVRIDGKFIGKSYETTKFAITIPSVKRVNIGNPRGFSSFAGETILDEFRFSNRHRYPVDETDTDRLIPGVPSFAVQIGASKITQAERLPVVLNTKNFPDGENLYWKIIDVGTGAGTNGFQITGATQPITSVGFGTFYKYPDAAFSLVPNANSVGKTFYIEVRTLGSAGPIVARSDTFEVVSSFTSSVPYAKPMMPGLLAGLDEGRTYSILIYTQNVPLATKLYSTIKGSASSSDFPTGQYPTITSTINTLYGVSSETITTIQPIDEGVADTGEQISLEVRTGSDTGPLIGTSDDVTINDPAGTPIVQTPTYTMSATSSSVNEGSSITITVNTTNVADGTLLNWTIPGVSDFSAHSGTVVINNNSGSFVLTANADNENESNEQFAVILSDTSGNTLASITITINNVSVAAQPTYSVVPAKNSVNEGDSINFAVYTTNVSNGTTLYWTIQSNSFTDFVEYDSSQGRTGGSFTINNNTGTFTANLTNDNTTEGSETFNVSIRTGSISGQIVATSSTVTINDTSLSAPTYTLTQDGGIRGSINEGTSVSFTLTTTNVPDGTVLYPRASLGPANLDEDDFSQFPSSITVINNSANFTITAAADNKTEGTEAFLLRIYDSAAYSRIVAQIAYSFNILDTSTDIPSYTLSLSSQNIDEGGSITATVTTTNVPNGTTLVWDTGGNQDLAINTGTVTINNNIGSFTINAIEDNTTEGSESFILTIRDNTKILASSSPITINDTSTTPIPIPPTYSIVSAENNIDEGNTLTFSITTTNVPDNTILYWTVSDITQFPVGSGPVVIINGSASFNVTPILDNTTEGTTNFTASLRTDSISGPIVATSDNILINDTSRTKSYLVLTNNSNNDSSDIYPGNTITYTILTGGVEDGTTLYITNYPGTEASSFVDNLDQTTITITNDSATFEREVSENILTPKIAKIHLRTDSYTGLIVAESDLLNILPITISYSITENKASVDEGDTIVFTISATGNVPDGTPIYWELKGNFNNEDFDGPTSGQTFINSKTAFLPFDLNEDLTIESESFYLEIRELDPTGQLLATSNTITINDTTVLPTGPTYSLSSSVTSVTEGSSVTFTLNTTNLEDNSLVRWIVAGNNVNSADFLGISTLEGNFNVVANTASVTFNVNPDERTEGVEYFYLTLPDVPDAPIAPVSISDSSRAPIGDLAKFYINSNTPVIDEGVYLYFQVSATGLTSNIDVPWTLQGIPTQDILGNINRGSVRLLETQEGLWTGEVQVGILENFKTEGTRTALLTIDPGIPYILEVSQSVIVKDTSLDRDPRYNLLVDKTRVIEGGNVTVTVFATNVPDNSIVPLQILPWDDVDFHPDEADFSDIANVRQLYFPPLKNNTASYTVTVLDDFKFEQTEYFYFNIPGTIASSQVVEIIDSGNTLITSNATFSGNIILGFLDKAVLTPEIGGLTIGASDWEDLSGKLSESIYVQGRIPDASPSAGIFYQPFSYVIRSSISIELWRESIKKVLHPAGLALFSEIDTETLPGEEFNVEPKKDGPVTITDFFALTADNARLPFCASNVKYTNTRFSVDLKSDFAYYIHKEL